MSAVAAGAAASFVRLWNLSRSALTNWELLGYRLLFIFHKYETALFWDMNLTLDSGIFLLSVCHRSWYPQAGSNLEILQTNPAEADGSRSQWGAQPRSQDTHTFFQFYPQLCCCISTVLLCGSGIAATTWAQLTLSRGLPFSVRVRDGTRLSWLRLP